MLRSTFRAFLVLFPVFYLVSCQEYDFAAEITRQCLVPDPVGLLDCVENKVTLPYLTSWVDCTNSLGQNVRTSADIINYRCKSVWEGKGVIPEVFYIKDCVIEKTGLPAKNVSAEVLGAYKECESTPQPQQQRIKTAPVQQQQLRTSSVEYQPPIQQFQSPVVQPPPQQFQVPVSRPPIQQFQAPVIQPQPQQFQVPVARPPIQQFQAPIFSAPPQLVQIQAPVQQARTPLTFQPQNLAPRQQFQVPAQRPFQPQPAAPVQRPVQQQIQVSAPRPIQQAPSRTFAPPPQFGRSMQPTQQQVPVALTSPPAPGPQYPALQPQSQQFFVIYPQAPLPNQQQVVSTPNFSQKTANPGFIPQQQISASVPQVTSINPNAAYSYSFQISHPLRPTF